MEERKYRVNPKMRGSGIYACIPQTGECPYKCEDCYFQSGRSYLEPLAENLPNIPPILIGDEFVIRMNDGNDSSVKKDEVMTVGNKFHNRFYNTSNPDFIDTFDGPVVLTVNPGQYTDKLFHALVNIPVNLMYVRVRVNAWNLDLVERAVEFYTSKKVPVILTFMAYYNIEIDEKYKNRYEFRKRTVNSYWCLNKETMNGIIARFSRNNKYVYSCGSYLTTECRYCGNCIREFYNTKDRMINGYSR